MLLRSSEGRRGWPVVALVAFGGLAGVLAGCDGMPWEDQDDGEDGKAALGASPVTSCAGPANEIPRDLACTGLYADFAARQLAPSARHYTPGVTLWSDGYDTDRFIALPDNTKIDSSAIDDWKFPVGTKLWKEIRHGQRKVETRFFWKVEQTRWLQAAYVWSEDGTRAELGDGRDLIVDGKPYHVPKLAECNSCHRGRKDKALGFEAVGLALPGATGVTLATLAAEGRLEPPPPRTTLELPQPGPGVLHANCGITCHNGSSNASAFSTGLRMRLGFDEVASKPPAEWELVKSTVGVDAKMPGWSGEVRVRPGAPEASLLVTVMKLRGEGQMPPLATDIVDAQGVAAVEAWIQGLPAP